MNNLTDYVNHLFDSIDKGLEYIGVQLLKLPTFKVFTYIITPKVQTLGIFITGFIVGIASISNTYAHGGHGDEEAEQLGNTTITLSGETFTNPKEVNVENIANQSYPGIVMSDEYGSIFSSREGIVTKLQVNLGDTVKKGQTVATISTASNSPEIIALLAGKRADIAMSQGQLNASQNVLEYLKNQSSGSGNVIQNIFDQKKNAIDISINTQKQQLQAKINSLSAQIDAKKQITEATKVSSQSTIGLNEQKRVSQEAILYGSIKSAIGNLGQVFANGETSPLMFDAGFNRNIYWGARNSSSRNVFQSLMRESFAQLSKWDTLSSTERIAFGELIKKTVNEGITLLGSSITHSEYLPEQLSKDIALLNETLNNTDNGLIVVLSKFKELEKELVGSNAIASGGIAQANADLIGLDQEILLLQKEVELLDAERNKELAELEGDQSIRTFDLQKMIIEAQADILNAEAELNANQNALGAIQSTAKSTIVTAPFAGTISRKNVVVGQSIDTSTPLFDIVGLSSNSDAFVRFEVPVAEYSKLEIGKLLQINLGGDDLIIAGSIKRIAQSVNQNTQTITVEGVFTGSKSPYPLGTNVRVSSQGLIGETVVEIPHTAIGTDESGESFVYKVLPDNTLKKWIIEIGYTEGDKSYINRGLKVSDTIVTNIESGEWRDGMTVEVIKE